MSFSTTHPVYIPTSYGKSANRQLSARLVAKVSRDRYWWRGEFATRAFREWQLLYHLHRAGLPVPTPVAARYRRHGLMYTADILTDSFRALLLRIAGYRTDVFEFITKEDTARNLMIRAVRGAPANEPAFPKVRSMSVRPRYSFHPKPSANQRNARSRYGLWYRWPAPVSRASGRATNWYPAAAAASYRSLAS